MVISDELNVPAELRPEFKAWKLQLLESAIYL